MGYSPWDCKELDTTEQLTLSLSCLYFTDGKIELLSWVEMYIVHEVMHQGSDRIKSEICISLLPTLCLSLWVTL